uniref:Uncharacterized protein n=1 Tax=Chlorobium chlorochromatii (strain CaD3) TaxID=340177 RepID=Q3APB0_CHLCH
MDFGWLSIHTSVAEAWSLILRNARSKTPESIYRNLNFQDARISRIFCVGAKTYVFTCLLRILGNRKGLYLHCKRNHGSDFSGNMRFNTK